MAWILATYPDPNIRDADKAIELAEKAYQQNEDKIGKNFDIANYVPKVQIGRAIQLPGEVFVPVGEETGYMDTLAAAYAAKGQFDRAIEQAEKALELAKTSGAQDTKMTEDIRKRLNLYREGKPYYDFALSTKDKNTIPDK